MRKKPIRGEKYLLLPQNIEVTILEKIDYDTVKVILPDGKISTVSAANLNLPIIDTATYEKLVDAAA